MVSHQMITCAASYVPSKQSRPLRAPPSRGDLSHTLSARRAISFFNADGLGKTLVIMKGGKPYKLIPKVEEKGPKDGWDGDIH